MFVFIALKYDYFCHYYRKTHCQIYYKYSRNRFFSLRFIPTYRFFLLFQNLNYAKDSTSILISIGFFLLFEPVKK